MGPVSAPSFRVRVIFEAEKAISEFFLILKNLTNDELSDLFYQNNSYAVMSNDKQFIFNTRHSFEKLQSKMCKNALGMNKNVPDHLVKAEMCAFPIMGFFL